MEEIENQSKITVGMEHPIPEGHDLFMTLGGYQLTKYEGAFYICGTNAYNVSTNPVQNIEIMPSTPEHLLQEVALQNEHSIGNSYYLDKYAVYYLVKYGEFVYIFDTFEEAIQLVGILVQFKANGLLRANKEKVDLEIAGMTKADLEGEL